MTGSPTIIEMNKGEKIQFTIEGNNISFRDDELILNLSKNQKDFDRSIDISEDESGALTMGKTKWRYLAQIFIPGRTATLVQASDTTNSTPDAETDQVSYTKTALPFDISTVVIRLWAI